jgi:hypothetical protein
VLFPIGPAQLAAQPAFPDLGDFIFLNLVLNEALNLKRHFLLPG